MDEDDEQNRKSLDEIIKQFKELLNAIEDNSFGRQHCRVPDTLLLDKEKSEWFSVGTCFLVLVKSIPKKGVFKTS